MEEQGKRSNGCVSGLPANARYIAKVDADKLTDEIADLIDYGIRKDKYATFDEWQEAVSKLLNELEAPKLTEDQEKALRTPCGPMCAPDDHLRYASRGKCGLCGRDFI